MSIYLGEGKEYNDMQGPCEVGFHIPTKDELTSVNNILKLRNTYSWTLWRVYLHMPYAGSMSATSGGSVGGGSTAYYWSSTWGGDRPVSLYMQSNKLNIQPDYYTTNGMPIRPFKDEPVAADSNWTLEFQGTWGGGIYHNSTLGLISISWDGSTWTTIADKNLGATTVYNSGDTLSAENCGKYYQRGNNYGFPKSGATTTSTTLVNASSYGPGNYYNNDTFIKSGVSNWDTSNNSNLRGGVSQGSIFDTGIKSAYIGDTKAKAVYVGDIAVWKKQLHTITITYTEASDPSQWNPTYSDDAAGMTTGDSAFDEFFGYSGVRLNGNGVETAQLDLTNMSSYSDLGSGDNVMVKFPIRGIKMSKSGSTVTLSITDELNKDGYQYYAFNRNGTIQDKFYLGVYEGTGSSSKITSLSGLSPITSIDIDSARNACIANGSNYQQITCWMRWYVTALYMMKYGNPNSKSVIGNGYLGGSSKQTTGATNSILSSTGATDTTTTGRIKLFGLEDFWGNVCEHLDGVRHTQTGTIVDTSNSPSSLSGHPSYAMGSWVQAGNDGYNYYGVISSTISSNLGMFITNYFSGVYDYTQYYCSSGQLQTGTECFSGGNFGLGTSGGLFFTQFRYAYYDTSRDFVGCRLAYL